HPDARRRAAPRTRAAHPLSLRGQGRTMTHENGKVAWPPEWTEDRIHCVYLTCFRPEFSSLAIVLQYSGIQVQQAESLEEADFLLTVTGATVFLTDVALPDGDWRDALRMA